MAFNFGQYHMGNDSDIYIENILYTGPTEAVEFSNNKVYCNYDILNNTFLTNGNFFIKVLISPIFDKKLEVKIYLKKDDDSLFLFKTQMIEEGLVYLPYLLTLDNTISDLQSEYTIKQTLYEEKVSIAEKARIAKEAAKEAWLQSGGVFQSDLYIAWQNAISVYNDAINIRDAVKNEIDELESAKREVKNEYDDLLEKIEIPIEKSVYISSDIKFKSVIIEISVITDTDYSGAILPSLAIIKPKELLNNAIPQSQLKRIGIQGTNETRCYINNNELTIDNNGVLEINYDHFIIRSLKIIPKDFFIIDYTY